MPSFKSGTWRMVKIKSNALWNGVSANTILITKNTSMEMPAGISAAKDLTTVGGTPSGIRMTQPFLFTQA